MDCKWRNLCFSTKDMISRRKYWNLTLDFTSILRPQERHHYSFSININKSTMLNYGSWFPTAQSFVNPQLLRSTASDIRLKEINLTQVSLFQEQQLKIYVLLLCIIICKMLFLEAALVANPTFQQQKKYSQTP